tara:strand:- start:3051 stop:4058 length:1008 start_codon:yes stop_codon:yes gene_type:complete
VIINIIPKPKGPFSLKEISEETNCSYIGNKNISIYNVSSLNLAKKGELSFLDNLKYLNSLDNCNASAIIVPSKISDRLNNTKAILLKSDNAYASYAKALQKFYPYKSNNYHSNRMESNNVIDKDALISNKAIVENNVHIKSGTVVKSFSIIGPNVILGKNCLISNNVNISNAIIGNNTIVHAGTIIGGDGFGFAPLDGEFIKIPQIGIVKIGDNVEIGSNCTIDKGSLNHTEIKNGVKIDNLVHIAHNVVIGKNTVIAGQTGIAGSTYVGNNVMIGGQTGIAGHLKIGNNVKIGAQAGVTKNVKDNSSISGTPAIKLSSYLKKTVLLNKMVEKND